MAVEEDSIDDEEAVRGPKRRSKKAEGGRGTSLPFLPGNQRSDANRGVLASLRKANITIDAWNCDSAAVQHLINHLNYPYNNLELSRKVTVIGSLSAHHQ